MSVSCFFKYVFNGFDSKYTIVHGFIIFFRTSSILFINLSQTARNQGLTLQVIRFSHGVSDSVNKVSFFTKKTSSTFSPRVEIFAECIDILYEAKILATL